MPRRVGNLNRLQRKKIESKISEKVTIPDASLTRMDVLRYRWGVFENMCFEALQCGLHETFREIFNLITQEEQMVRRDLTASNSSIRKCLRYQEKELEILFITLGTAESTKFSGELETEYQCYLLLFLVFSESMNYHWLAKHFLSKRIHFIRSVIRDISYKLNFDATKCNLENELLWARKREAETLFHMAEFCQDCFQFNEAADLYRNLREISKNSLWPSPESPSKMMPVSLQCLYNALKSRELKTLRSKQRSLFMESSANLCDVLLRLTGSKLHLAISNIDVIGSFKCLDEALHLANEVCDSTLLLRQYYLRGRLFEILGKNDDAIMNMKQCYDIAREGGNFHMESRSSLQLAALNEKYGNFQESLDYFSNVRRIAFSIDCKNSLMKAELGMGRVYDKLPNREVDAELHCAAAFNSTTGTSIHARVWFGISRAHRRMFAYIRILTTCSTDASSLAAILDWKCARKELPL